MKYIDSSGKAVPLLLTFPGYHYPIIWEYTACTMQPATIALAIALSLFLLVQGLKPPLLYVALLIPAAILIYGLISRDYPEEPYVEETEADSNGSPDTTSDKS
jgi:hypothetical protein